MEFCLILRELRAERQLTQEQVAHALGISRQSIIQLEHGRFMPSFEVTNELARFFDISFDELLGIPKRKQTASVTQPVVYNEDASGVTVQIQLTGDVDREAVRAELKAEQLVITLPNRKI